MIRDPDRAPEGAGDDAIASPLALLRHVCQSLRPHGKALFTVLNGYRMIRSNTPGGDVQSRFDPLTLSTVSMISPAEGQPPISVRERAFVPTELDLLFRLAGMRICNMWGGTAGNWARNAIDLDEFEIMIVARKADERPTP